MLNLGETITTRELRSFLSHDGACAGGQRTLTNPSVEFVYLEPTYRRQISQCP